MVSESFNDNLHVKDLGTLSPKSEKSAQEKQNLQLKKQLDDLVNKNMRLKTPYQQLHKKLDVAMVIPEILTKVIAKGATKSIMKSPQLNKQCSNAIS